MLTGKSLTGQVAIVTGASRGIGKAVAQTLAAEGATVIINYNGSAEAAEAVATDIRSLGGVAEAVKCNVADFAESEAFVKAVTEKYGRVDILVNNAGITRDNLIVRMTEEEFNAVLDTNLKGAFHMIKHLGRTFMKQRYGKIINISSVSGVVGNAGQANYSASKAGLIGLTKSVARELAELLHSTGGFFVHILCGIKILHFRRQLTTVIRSIKIGYRTKSGLALFDTIPEFLYAVSNRSDGSHTCYYNSSIFTHT